jgi:hypothetical protein
MPGFDRTGPAGGGSRTGWGRGQCGQATGVRRFPWSGLWRGIGRGGQPLGGGRGRCFGGGWRFPFVWGASATPTEEAEALKAEIAATKEEMAAMEARLGELEKKK